MREKPLVSVIIPVFNSERFIGEALESVLSQDYPNLEIIAIDDGSTDGTAAIVREYAPRVRFLEQPNRGPAAARNRGVHESRGKYLAFLDADDVWLPGKLSAQIEHAEAHPEHAIVFAQFAHWGPDEHGGYLPAAEFAARYPAWDRRPRLSGWLYADVLRDSIIHIITAIIRRDALDALGGFDESLRAGSDYDFWLKATYRFQAHQIPLPAALYRLNAAGVTSAAKPINYGYLVLTRALKQFGSTGPDGRTVPEREMEERLAKLCFGYGRVHYRKGSLRVAREAFYQSLKHSTANPRVFAYLGLSVMLAPFVSRTERR